MEHRPLRLVVTDAQAYDWGSQYRQYPPLGPSGISYFAGPTVYGNVDCLLWRDESGKLRGVLNHYGFDCEWESKGNVNVFIDPEWRRRGIATVLVDEARRRWVFNPEQQTYTEDGLKFITRYLRLEPHA